MATLHVRNVPDDLYELLREHAAANDRSIGAETIQLLHERLVAGPGRPPRRFPLPGRRRPSGPGLFTRFAPAARQAVVAAQEYARELGHDHVGTEHLLVGVLDTASGSPFGKTLGRLGLTAKRVRADVERASGRGASSPTGQIPFEPSAKQALEIALREALKLGDSAIYVNHMLLGILGVEGGGCAVALEIEPNAEKLRRCAVTMRPHPPAGAAAAAGASIEGGPLLAPQPSFKVILLDGDADAWERQLNEAAVLGYDLLDVVDRRAILRRT
jgi:hypothetical protein